MCADAAKYLAEKLTHETKYADLKTYNGEDIEKFDWIIIGGSVYAGQVLKEAVSFCELNSQLLLTKNLVLFVCCTTPDNAIQYMKNAYPADVFNHASEKVNFGGEIRPEKLSFPMRMAVEMMKKRSDGTKKAEIAYDSIDNLAQKLNAMK